MANPEFGHLETEWHPTLNFPIEFGASLYKTQKYWWICSLGHEWKALLDNRVRKAYGCPICSGQRLLTGFNDLATTHPSLTFEWHPTKNGQLTPQQVAAGAHSKVWWQCTIGHEWEAALGSRKNGTGCPICSNRRILVGFNDLATTHPPLAAEWHPTKNKVSPLEIIAGSPKKAWWLGACNHEWEAVVRNRTRRGDGCPVCVGKTILIGFNDLATTHPALAAEWHPTKNGDLTPQQVVAGKQKELWWLGGCGHEWATQVSNRKAGKGCPYCSKVKVLVGFNDLATTHPALAAEWHPTKNGNLQPQKISKGAEVRIWWLGQCGHEWDSLVAVRTGTDFGCPVCSSRKILVGFNDLATTHPALAAEWHPTNNAVSPQEIIAGSPKKAWWLGACGHEWESIIQHRGNGVGCPQCSHLVSKPEIQIREFLEGLGLVVEASNRSLLNGKEIDLWIPQKKIGIEFNGIYWHTESRRKGNNYHYDKWNLSRKLGIKLIQIWEDDWNLHPELILRALGHKVSTIEPMARDTKVVSITDQRAKEFLNENHFQGFARGKYYLGLVEAGDTIKPRAVMVLGSELNGEGQSLEIIRYASIANASDDFSKLLSGAINKYDPRSIAVTADHCDGDDGFYVSHDFFAEKEFPPDYMYVIRTERKPRSEYGIERLRDDPALVWEDGLTEMELADLNGLKRIWDAGKTLYRLYV